MPLLGITGEGWGFQRIKDRGGQKKNIISGLKKRNNNKQKEIFPKQTVPFTGSSIKIPKKNLNNNKKKYINVAYVVHMS